MKDLLLIAMLTLTSTQAYAVAVPRTITGIGIVTEIDNYAGVNLGDRVEFVLPFIQNAPQKYIALATSPTESVITVGNLAPMRLGSVAVLPDNSFPEFVGTYSQYSDPAFPGYARLFAAEVYGEAEAGHQWGQPMNFTSVLPESFGTLALTNYFTDIREIRFQVTSLHVSPIPEPETWFFMIVGLALVGWKLRHRLPEPMLATPA